MCQSVCALHIFVWLLTGVGNLFYLYHAQSHSFDQISFKPPILLKCEQMEEGDVALYTTPNPLLLNEICLNQNASEVHCSRCHGYLSDIGLVRHEREVVHADSPDVRLQHDVHFAVVVLHSARHGKYAILLEVPIQLTHLLISYLKQSINQSINQSVCQSVNQKYVYSVVFTSL